MNQWKLTSFLKRYRVFLILFVISIGIFSWTLQGELQEHNMYMAAKAAGDLLGMGEMKINENGQRLENGNLRILNDGAMFGPYMNYSAGNFILEIDCHFSAPTEGQTISITSDGGIKQIGTYPIHEAQNKIAITLPSDQKRVEFVVRNETEGLMLTISNVRFYAVLDGTMESETELAETNVIVADFDKNVVDSAKNLLDIEKIKINEYGEKQGEGTVVLSADGVMFGPYIDLPAGSYTLQMQCNFSTPVEGQTIAVTAESGAEQLGEYPLHEGLNQITLLLLSDQKQMELVVRNEFANTIIQLSNIALHDSN